MTLALLSTSLLGCNERNALGLPLVRIDSAYLRRERRFTLIGYLVEACHLERAFDEAQARGAVFYDEPFIIENFLTDSLEGPIDWPYWLDRPARLAMVDAYRDGDLRSATPEEIITPYPKSEASDDAEGRIAPIDLGSAFAENAAECSTMASHHSPNTRSDDDPIGPTFTRASNSSCRRRETSANGRATW